MFAQYTFTTAFDSGNPPVGVTNVATTCQELPVDPTLIYNANLTGLPLGFGGFNANPNYPSQTSTQQTAFVASGVNIDMHTFTLGVDFTKDLNDILVGKFPISPKGMLPAQAGALMGMTLG